MAPADPPEAQELLQQPPTAEPATLETARISERRRWWAAASVLWALLVIATGGWLLSWFVHVKVVSFPFEDSGVIAFMIAAAALLLLLLIKVPEWQTAGLSGTDLERFDAENESPRRWHRSSVA
jgi:hypothetical protein